MVDRNENRGSGSPSFRDHRSVRSHYCRTVWQKILVAVLAVTTMAVVWAWPGFSEPSHRARDCQDGSTWGYDVLARGWTCSDNWVLRVGNNGVTGI